MADGQPNRIVMPDDREVVDVADVFKLLGDPGRVRILTSLLDHPVRVRDIAAATGMGESAVSHALRLMRAHRVVTARRVGREAHYELADTHVRALLQLALDHAGHTTVLHVAGHEEHSDDECDDEQLADDLEATQTPR